MLTRSRQEEIRFAHPFSLPGEKAPFPAGLYTVGTEEELIEGLSFPAYRRVSTTLTPAADRGGAPRAMTPVDPLALDRARAADEAAPPAAGPAEAPPIAEARARGRLPWLARAQRGWRGAPDA